MGDITDITESNLPAFRAWLLTKRPLGVAMNADGFLLGFADTSQAWVVSFDETRLVRTIISAVVESGRRAWSAEPAVVHRLASVTGYRLPAFKWINDLTVVWAGAHPGIELTAPVGGAGPRARQNAKIIAELNLVLPEVARPSIAAIVELDKAFRESQARGVRIDVAGLHKAVEENRAASAVATLEDGVDLSRLYTVLEKTAATDWLNARGIVLTDLEGQPSLARDHFSRAVVPNTSEGAYAWGRFRSAATRLSARLALQQIVSNVRSDGHVFPQINLRGAKTGRGTVVGPNLTALSKAYRYLIIPEPGFVFIALDLDRAEPSTAAGLSGDPVLKADLSSGDVYQELAVSVFGESARADAEARKICKTAFIATLYGQGAKSQARRLGISVVEASRVIAGIWGRYEVLAAYCEGLKQASRDGVDLRTPWGRLLPKANRGDYQLPNFAIQAAACDLFYMGVIRVVAKLGGSCLVLPIHDELLIQCLPEDAFKTAAFLEEAMTVEMNGVTVGGVSKKLGSSWSR
jgi:hypothetical protein